MIDISSAFFYKDALNGEILLNPDHDKPKRPCSELFGEEYKEEFAEFIDGQVEKARQGNLLCCVDVLMTLAYFLERKWPLPDSLTKYAANILEEAIVAFGHTEGKLEKKNAAICRALGLVKQASRPKTEEDILKHGLVHSYIWWRVELLNESPYTAARNAANAFKGTKGLSRKNCENIYSDREEDKFGKRTIAPSLSLFIDLKLYPSEFCEIVGNIVFNDDDFLRMVAHRLKEITHPSLAQFFVELEP